MRSYPPFIFRALYWYLDRIDKQKQLTFMNFGYSDNSKTVPLRPEDEQNRYPLQLYHHMAEMVDLTGKDVVDVGSGRGGGLSFIARQYNPSSMKGIDRGKNSVEFCNNKHRYANLKFICGDAHRLPIPNESCDILLNVESSHRYTSMSSFLNEVSRTLRPGGYFLFTDFRYDEKWPELLELIGKSGLLVLEQKDITENVVKSLELDSQRRTYLVEQFVPKLLRKKILNFTGSKGTETFDFFSKRKFTYKSFKVIKPAIN